MKPIKLRIEGLRSFRTGEPAEIDFRGRPHIAIVGDTGSGKSSILEAITWALYGVTSYAGHANQELMNDDSSYLRVLLTFEAQGRSWEVARLLTRKRNGDVGGAQATLRETGPGAEGAELTSGIKEVNRRAAEIVGLDAPAFLRTIVLPQGRFARLLTEDEPRSRAEILRQVWRTDELEGAGETAGEAARDARTTAARLAGVLAALPAEPEAWAEEQEKRRDDAQGDATRHEQALARAEAAAEEAEHARQLAERAGRAARGNAPQQAAAARRTLEEAAAADRRIGEREEELAKEAASLETALDDAIDAKGVEEADNARRLARALEKAVETETAAVAGEAAAQRAVPERKRTRAAADRRAAEEESAHQASERQWRRSDALAASEREAAEHLGTVEQEWTRFEAGERRRAAEAAERRATGLQEEKQATERAAREEAAYGKATRTAERARERMAAWKAGRRRRPGEPCPVCARTLPPGWKPAPGNGCGGEEQALEAAGRERNAAAAAAATATARRRDAEETASRTAERLAHAVEQEEHAWRRLAERAGVDPGAAREREYVVAGAMRRREEAADRALRGREELRQAREAWNEAAGATASAQAAAERAAAAEEELRRKAAEARAAARAAWEKAETAGWSGERTAEAAAGGRTAAEATAEEGQARVRRARELAGKLEQARSRQQKTATERRQAVTEPAARAGGEAEAALARATAAADDVGHKGPSALPANGNGGTGLDRAEAIEKYCAEVAEAAGRREQEARETEAKARREIRDAAAEVGVDGKQETEGCLATLRSRTAGARTRAAETGAAAARARDLVPAVTDAQEALAEIERRGQLLDELATALRPGQFPKWLTLRRSTDLLRHASRRLETMTGGRWAFRDPRDTEEAWRVLDRSTGATRSPATLSGGEQFIASLALALALGMVETMGRRGGRLESFFLDEGFGSLDRNALEAAAEALADAAGDDHHVGIITHVREAAAAVPDVLLVERAGSRGSRARWLDADERASELEGNLTAVR